MKELLSIEERKVSVLMLCLILLVLFIIIMNFLEKSIFEGIVTIIQSLIFGVVGVNGVNAIDNYVGYKSRLDSLEPEAKEGDQI